MSSEFSVQKICKALSVSKSGYYKWKKTPVSKREQDDLVLLEYIKFWHIQSRERFGSPRIVAKLREDGHDYNHKRVERIMKENGIRSKAAKKYKVTTDSNHTKEVAPNLLKRDFKPSQTNVAWCGDITYLRTQEGWLYLAVVIDLFSRKVIGWSMSERMTTSLVVDAFNMAWTKRDKPKGVIFHSDRGSQYASNEFKSLLSNYGICQSMSRKGDCWDNACAESFFASLKKEEVYMTPIYPTRAYARDCIFEYIELFYNTYRPHSFIGWSTPKHYEEMISLEKVA